MVSNSNSEMWDLDSPGVAHCEDGYSSQSVDWLDWSVGENRLALVLQEDPEMWSPSLLLGFVGSRTGCVVLRKRPHFVREADQGMVMFHESERGLSF